MTKKNNILTIVKLVGNKKNDFQIIIHLKSITENHNIFNALSRYI